MVRFLDDVNHPAVKANIDVSHLQLSGTAPEELAHRECALAKSNESALELRDAPLVCCVGCQRQSQVC